jgi:hypothetical protein
MGEIYIDITTFNKRIAECIHRRYNGVLDSGKCDYGKDDTERGVSYYFNNIKMTLQGIENLAREIDFYVDNVSMEHNENLLEKFGGYVIQNHNTGRIIRINRSFLEEKVVLELQKS